MLHRKLSDTERWQAIGLIKAGIKHRRVGENLTCDFEIAIQWPASASFRRGMVMLKSYIAYLFF
jgi:hypothetical protein